MNMINALAISIGALAFVATWLCLGTGAGLQVWALFIGWGSFYHCGGKTEGLIKSVTNHIWGIVVAALALILVGSVAGSVVITSALVGLSVVVLVLGAHLPALSTIPAAVYGYAATAGFALLSGVAIGEAGAMLKAAALVAASMVIGNLFGWVSEMLAGKMVKAA